MDVAENNPQIVHVISSCRLLDIDSCERTYWRCDGLGLAPGWYVASWPPGAISGRFNEATAFRGPFGQREEAEAQLRQMNSRAQVREALAAKAATPALPAPTRSSLEPFAAGGITQRGPQGRA